MKAANIYEYISEYEHEHDMNSMRINYWQISDFTIKWTHIVLWTFKLKSMIYNGTQLSWHNWCLNFEICAENKMKRRGEKMK